MKNLTLQSIRYKKEKREKLNNFLLEVKKEMILNNIYYKKTKFGCYTDSIFSYYYKNHTTLFEFNFICDDTLLDKLTVKELLELKDITFFESTIYDQTNSDLLLSKKVYSLDNENGIDLYNELSKDLTEDQLIDGFYISDGIYLNSDGTYTEC
jgi:hypothetical protein